MSNLKFGDRVEVVNVVGKSRNFFEVGFTGTIKQELGIVYLVEFDQMTEDVKQHNSGNEWYCREEWIKVIEKQRI